MYTTPAASKQTVILTLPVDNEAAFSVLTSSLVKMFIRIILAKRGGCNGRTALESWRLSAYLSAVMFEQNSILCSRKFLWVYESVPVESVLSSSNVHCYHFQDSVIFSSQENVEVEGCYTTSLFSTKQFDVILVTITERAFAVHVTRCLLSW